MVLNIILGLLALICAIWVIYDVWTVKTKMKTEFKILWTVGAIFFSILTAIIYYFIEKK